MSWEVDIASSARTLEVFLDRLSWRAMKNDSLAAENPLDKRYYEGAAEDDKALREALEDFESALPDAARSSSRWNRVEQTLADLGFRREEAVDNE